MQDGIKTITYGGIAMGGSIAFNPNKSDDDNLAHTTAIASLNNGKYWASFAQDCTNQVGGHTKLLALQHQGKL